MKKIIYAMIMSVAGLSLSQAHTPGHTEQLPGVGISEATLTRNAELMSVNMTLDLTKLELPGNLAVVLVPQIRNGADSVELKPVGFYGRTRWYQYVRSGDEPLGGTEETTVKWSEVPVTMNYSQHVPYAEWMNGSELVLIRADYGCCRDLLKQEHMHLAGYEHKIVDYVPEYRFVRPVAAPDKTRELSGRAYVDFVVNRTEINPTYHNNTVELRKIIATIDSVRNDKDVTVSAITIKGFASPEGSYTNNIRLAKGRTESLKQYVQDLYKFEEGFIKTDYEPEDWEGLRAYVEMSVLPHRSEILALIDSDMEPDPKNTKIQTTYPEEYRFLLREVYPVLRHSDYTIQYKVRTFTDIEEIRAIMATAPQKLSLNEMVLLAQSYEVGSEEFNAVFETAVRMFPEDETANLNAANAAMQRKDYASAEKYLTKAGESGEVKYARGVLAALRGDYDAAIELIGGSQVEDAARIVEHLQEVKLYAPQAARE